MKKVVLFFAAVAAISLASCGGNASTEAPKAEDEDTTAAEEVVPVDTVPAAVADSLAKDSTIADSTVAPAADTTAAKAE